MLQVATTYLQVSKLRELLATIVKSASKWLDLLVDYFMGADIASLSKSLAADVASIRSLSSMATLMGLEITKLREPLTTGNFLANLNIR